MAPMERLRARGMIQAGVTHRRVAIALKRDQRIIDRLWYVQTGSTMDRARSDKPHVTSARCDQYIVVNFALHQRSLNSRRLREQFRPDNT